MRTAGVARARRRARSAAPPARLLFRAFSDPIRLRILNLVRRREMCVGDLVTLLRVPQATASRHLTYLRRARLVSTRKSGLWVYYSLAPTGGSLHRSLLKCLDACFGEMPELAADAERYMALKKSGGCCPR
jgi:ArsR family transcriptional regulator